MQLVIFFFDTRPEPQTHGPDNSTVSGSIYLLAMGDGAMCDGGVTLSEEECLLIDDGEEEEADSLASLRRLLQANQVEQGFA